jgi:hypothetical protein
MSVTSWDELTEQVADRLQRLRLDEVLILLAPGNRYTEVSQLQDRLALDTVSNEFLPPDGRLDADQERQLEAMGWQRPTPPIQPLWIQEVQKWPLHSSDAERVADLMVSTLRDVHAVKTPSEIELNAFIA